MAQAHAHLASLRVLGRGLKGEVPAVGGRRVSGVSGGGAHTSGLAQFTSVRWWWCFFWSRGLRRWRKQMRKICGLGGWYRGVVGWGTGESHLAVLRGRGGPRGVHVGPCSHRQRLLALASARIGTARVPVEMALLAHRRSALRRRSRGRGRWTAAAGR